MARPVMKPPNRKEMPFDAVLPYHNHGDSAKRFSVTILPAVQETKISETIDMG